MRVEQVPLYFETGDYRVFLWTMTSYFLRFVFILCFIVSSNAFADNIPTVAKDPSGLYGYKDAEGKYVIPAQFDQAFPFSNGSARVIWKGGWYLINIRGKFLTKKSFSNISIFRNGLAIVTIRGNDTQLLHGLINEKGDQIAPPQYQYFTPEPNYHYFIAGIELFSKGENNKVSFGLLDAAGKVIIPLNFSAIRHSNFQLFIGKDQSARWEAFDATGKSLFGGKYDNIKEFDAELACVKVNGKWGIVNAAGKMVVKPAYRDIVKKATHTYDLLPFIQWKVVDQKQQTILTMEYEDVRPVHPVLYSYQIEGKVGLLDEKGGRITLPLYDEIQPFVKEMAIVREKDMYGVINSKGNVMIPLQYQKIDIDTATLLLRVQSNGKWGVLNKANRTIVSTQYDTVRVQRYGMFTVRKDTAWQLLDATGKPVGDQTFTQLGDIQNLYAVAYRQKQVGLVNLRGSWAIEPVFDNLRIINEYIAQYYTGGRSGLISILTKEMLIEADMVEPIHNYLRIIAKGKYGVWNSRGREVIPVQYDYISDFTEDSVLTVFQKKNKGLINLQGRVILKPSPLYEELLVMKNERVGIKMKNKYGFVDKNGKLRIANRYEGIGNFSENMAAVKILGKWGFINKAEELVIQPNYEAVGQFEHGAAPVKKNGKWGLASKAGKEILKCNYDGVNWQPTGRYTISLNGKKGLADASGREIFPPRYDLIVDNDNGFVMLGKNNKLGLSDNKGYDVLPVIYDRLYFNSSKNFYITGIESPIQKFVYQP